VSKVKFMGRRNSIFTTTSRPNLKPLQSIP